MPLEARRLVEFNLGATGCLPGALVERRVPRLGDDFGATCSVSLLLPTIMVGWRVGSPRQVSSGIASRARWFASRADRRVYV